MSLHYLSSMEEKKTDNEFWFCTLKESIDIRLMAEKRKKV